MKNLLNQMKPHWRIILVIVIAHLVQAYMVLRLPEYTSNMVDIGIQNRGIEHAVPLSMTSETMETFEELLLPEEQALIDDNYLVDQNGIYTLDSQIEDNEQQMNELSYQLEVPLALMQTIRNMSDEELEMLQADTEGDTLAELREVFVADMEALGPEMIKNTAIQSVIVDYESAGGDLGDRQINYLLSQGGVMLLIALMAFAGGGTATFLAAVVGAKVGHGLRASTFEKVLSFSNKEMNYFSTASLITRSSNDIQQIQLIVTILLRIVIFSPLLAIGAMFYVIQTQSTMLWITALGVALVMILMGVLLYMTVPRFNLLQKQVDKVNLLAREILTGLQVIRAFGRQKYESHRFDGANTDLKNSFLFVGRVMATMMPLMMLIANSISVLIVWVAGNRISAGTMQVGDMMAFITYNMQVIFSFFMMTMMSIQIPRALVSSNRIQEVLEMPLSVTDREEPKVIESPKGLVEFDQVSFRFGEAEGNVVNDISFTAKPGETTAIIGGTGSGKSTMLNLLMRFYDPTEGRIKIDGIDIRELSQYQLREMIGFVPQKGVLFSGTIESNIGYGVEALSDRVRNESAEIAHASEFILDKDETYRSRISQGGTNVSGGQKQRLSIARAIAKQPNIFIFDDSFSALDYRTDASLRQALGEKVKDATVIIVAQRISTILDAEQIIVIEEGEVKGIGSHIELMETNAVYRDIATSQLSQAELDNYAQQLEMNNKEGE